MLDLHHPQTPHVFAAARQEDLILDYCKRITLSDAAGRRFMLEVMRPAFVALRWLNQERFGNSPEITSGIDQLEHEVQALVNLPASGTRDPCSAGSFDALCVPLSPSLQTNMTEFRIVQSVSTWSCPV